MSRVRGATLISKCPHSWIPLARYPHLALCFYCDGQGIWSPTLGRFIRHIPESHEQTAGAAHIGGRKQFRRPAS